jgi:predicted enzyme related to lactoylglutathione lyase
MYRNSRGKKEKKSMSTPASSPNYRTGKICYIEIPAIDISESASFYQRAFGWHIRQRGDGSTAFDDTTGEVSGTWVTGLPPASVPGLIVSIMVARIEATIEAIISAGGEIVRPVNPDEQEVYAHFRDPAGNILGIYQQPGLAETEAQ